jgi:hypothetical protein
MPIVSVCDLVSYPDRFDDRLVEVSGSINVQFESSSLVCRDRSEKPAPLSLGVWLSLDLDSIKERSPKFYEELAEGCRAAAQRKGGLIAEMRFRGHFTLSKEWLDTASPLGKQRTGLGHMGSYGAEIVVGEVLDYRSTARPNKAPEPTTTSVTSPAAQEPRQP